MTDPQTSNQRTITQTAATENPASAAKAEAYTDSFWDFADLSILGPRWNKAFPFRLRVWTKVNGAWTGDASPIGSFTLPIAPESVTIDTPFAISTTVTLGGIVEEHNGAPLRTISINATTGVTPLRGRVSSTSITRGGPGAASIFAGTLSGVSSLTTAVSQLGTGVGANNLIEENTNNQNATGFMQFQFLQRYLEAYVNLKKTAEAATKKKAFHRARDYILAWESWKEREIYFVTPVSFSRRRAASTALEYQYSIVFRAWKRVNPDVKSDPAFPHAPVAQDLNALSKALNSLQDARGVLEGARKTLNGVRSDINETLFEPLRELAVFAKDALGVALMAADLPASIISDLREPIVAAAGVAGGLGAFNTIPATYQKSLAGVTNSVQSLQQAFANLAVAHEAQFAKAPSYLPPPRPGAPQGAPATQGGSPAYKIFEHPEQYYDLFSGIRPSALKLPPATQKKLDAERARIANLKREDFELRRDKVTQCLVDFEDSLGLGGATYRSTYGTVSKGKLRNPTDHDFDVIYALNAAIIEMNKFVTSTAINKGQVNSIDYIAGLAARSGIAFKVPTSKFLVPMMYGHTLEQMSAMYLGTPDRWHEIAALNGLQAPYVDEIGFSLPLLTNGNGNTFTVADNSNFFVGQQVFLSSNSVSRIKRRIVKVETLSPGLVAVTVDGDATLSLYTVGAGAIVQAFLPNTVNSQQSLFIPSSDPVNEEDYQLKSVPGVDHFDPYLQVGGIDFLLTATGDLVITPDGDTRLAVGLVNIVQKVRLAFNTPRGTLLHHPEYGFPDLRGESTANISAQDILRICKELFKGDPTFTGVQSAAVLKDGPVVKIAISVGVAGSQQVVPITVEIPR